MKILIAAFIDELSKIAMPLKVLADPRFEKYFARVAAGKQELFPGAKTIIPGVSPKNVKPALTSERLALAKR